MTTTNESTDNIAGRELVISRLLNAPRELVFEAWTKPEHIKNWWGPDGFTTTIDEMNVKPGGIWRFIMHGPDGTGYPNRIVFEKVVKPERLVYWHGSDIDNDPDRFHVTVTFEEKGKQTNLILRSLFRSVAALEEVKKYGAVDGGKQTLSRLEKFLTTL